MTLLELMIVMLIVALLGSVALPNFLGQTSKAQNAQAVSSIKNASSAISALKVNETEDWSKYEDAVAPSQSLVDDLNSDQNGSAATTDGDLTFTPATDDSNPGGGAGDYIEEDYTSTTPIIPTSSSNIVVRYIDSSTIHVFTRSSSGDILCNEIVDEESDIHTRMRPASDDTLDVNTAIIMCDDDVPLGDPTW